MSFTDLIDNHGHKVSREHFIHLIQIARADGVISSPEFNFLHKEGRKFGLTDSEVDKLIKSEENHHYSTPYSLAEKFDELYNIGLMILADSDITDEEKMMMRKSAVAAGFDDASIDKLVPLLFEGIQKGTEEDELFKEFRKKHLFG